MEFTVERIESDTAAKLVVRLRGELRREAATELTTQVRRLLEARERALVLDFSHVGRADSSGAAAVVESLRAAHRAGARLEFENVQGQIRELLEMADLSELAIAEPPERAREPSFVERLGGAALQARDRFLDLADLHVQSLYWTFVAPFRGQRLPKGEVSRQILRMGPGALPIVGMITFLMGLILALQAAYQLRRFGANIYIADMVAIAFTREIGPIMTAILLAGRTGSAITAEIGTMVVTEEVDALQTIGIHPVRFLVAPKLLALVVSLPCLVVLADVIGILGGTVFATIWFGIPIETYLARTVESVYASDLITGLVKSLMFAVIIVQVGALQGFRIKGGAQGVGTATTLSVVVSLFFIVLTDLFFTTFFYVVR
jgi:phospholipid/cholesterol/gamma-HCH transport system permease protein